MGTKRVKTHTILAYDDGEVFQDCLIYLNVVRNQGLSPKYVEMSVETADSLIEDSDIDFSPEGGNENIKITIGNIPVITNASMKFGSVVFIY